MDFPMISEFGLCSKNQRNLLRHIQHLDIMIPALIWRKSCVSPHVRENPRQSWILDSMPWIPDSTPSQWKLDTGFQSLVGFRILWAVFRIPTSTIPDFTNKVFPGFGFHKQNFRIPLLGRGGRGWGGAGWVGVISRSPERQKCYLRH